MAAETRTVFDKMRKEMSASKACTTMKGALKGVRKMLTGLAIVLELLRMTVSCETGDTERTRDAVHQMRDDHMIWSMITWSQRLVGSVKQQFESRFQVSPVQMRGKVLSLRESVWSQESPRGIYTRSTIVDHGRPRSTMVDQGRPRSTMVDCKDITSTADDDARSAYDHVMII